MNKPDFSVTIDGKKYHRKVKDEYVIYYTGSIKNFPDELLDLVERGLIKSCKDVHNHPYLTLDLNNGHFIARPGDILLYRKAISGPTTMRFCNVLTAMEYSNEHQTNKDSSHNTGSESSS